MAATLERPQEGSPPKFIQILNSDHYLFALDENGKVWVLSKHICGNNSPPAKFDLGDLSWQALPDKVKDA